MTQRLVDEREHRRGLVLGLTLAEALILLLFLLLLALGARFDQLQKQADSARAAQSQLIASLPLLGPLLDELRAKGHLEIVDVQDLSAKIASITTLTKSVAHLTDENQKLRSKVVTLNVLGPDPERKIREVELALKIAAKIDPADPPAALIRILETALRDATDSKTKDTKFLSDMTAAVEELKAELAVTTSDRDDLRNRIATIGNGKGTTYPSCWANSQGQPDFIFDVTIRDAGLIAVDATPSRAGSDAWKLVDDFPRAIEINERVFQKATARLFAWSKSENCRFFAIIRDGTGPTSKERYKQLRTLVESHFYARNISVSRVATPTKQGVTTGSIPKKEAEGANPWSIFQSQ